MAKANVSRKWVSENYYCCSVGYCDLQNLLYFQSASYYTCGVYGWNFDVYTFGDYAITTGYRGMIDDMKSKDYHSLIREYEDKAKTLVDEYHNLWKEEDKREAKKEEVNNLLREFLSKVFDVDGNRFYV